MMASSHKKYLTATMANSHYCMADSHFWSRTTMSSTADKYILRLPQGMREQIRTRAEANRRSMNAEIVHYLDRALSVEKESPAGAATPPGHSHQQPYATSGTYWSQ